METLDIAISAAGGVGKLAKELGINANAISNWRLRQRIPHAWMLVLSDRYGSSKRKTRKTAGAK